MRIKNIEVIFKIPIPIDGPDGNGIIYSKDIIEQSIDSYKNSPIIVCNNDIDKIVGAIENAYIEADYIIAEGIIFNGGTCETAELENNIVVSDMRITSVGIDMNKEI